MAVPTRVSNRVPSATTATTAGSGGAGGVFILTAAALAATALAATPAPAAGQDQAPPDGGSSPPSVVTEVAIGQPSVTMSLVATGPAAEAGALAFDILPAMAMGPRPGRVEALRRPEFIRRDLPLFVDGLGFDGAQATIAETLLDEYGEAFALAVAPLEDALDRYRRQRSDRSLARMLDGSQEDGGIPALNGSEAVVFGGTEGDAVFMIRQPAAAGASGGGGAGAESAPAVVVARSITILTDAGGELQEADGDDSVVSLLERVRARLEAAERAGEIVTAEELVRLARRLRAERQLLRTEFLELLELIIEGEDPEAAEGRLAAVIERVRVERELPHGRLGGESLDLRAALAAAATTPDAAVDPESAMGPARQSLEAARTSLAAALGQRAQATADREIAGLEVLVARERREERIRAALERGTPMPTSDGPAPEVRRFVAASRRELDARVAVRDERLSRMTEIQAGLAETSPALAASFGDAAVTRGFPAETRPQWSDRALRYAEALEDLDATVTAAIAGIRLEHDLAARPLIDGRIAQRIAAEPGQVRDRIDAMLETERGVSVAFTEGGPSSGDDRTAQQRLDRQVRERLAAVLTPEQAESLPPTRRVLRLGGGGFSVEVGAPKDD